MSTWGAAGGRWSHIKPYPALRARDVVEGGIYETVAEIERAAPVVTLELLRVVCVGTLPPDEKSRNTRFLMVEIETGIALIRPKRAEDLAELVPDAGPRLGQKERPLVLSGAVSRLVVERLGEFLALARTC